MVRALLAGDQADELGQHPGQSRTGGRHHGCRGVGRGGRERPAAHLHWLPRGTCPGASANPASGAKCQNVLVQSCYRSGHDDRPRILTCKAVPNRQSALGLRIAGPTVVLAFAVAHAVEIALTQAVKVAVEVAVPFTLILAFDVTVSIPVEDRLRPVT
jgi:hypothetical protein